MTIPRLPFPATCEALNPLTVATVNTLFTIDTRIADRAAPGVTRAKARAMTSIYTFASALENCEPNALARPSPLTHPFACAVENASTVTSLIALMAAEADAKLILLDASARTYAGTESETTRTCAL